MLKYFLRGAGIAVFLLAVILGCQTTQTPLMAPTESAIQVESSGFSPHDTSGQNTIEISLLFGNPEAVKSWRVVLVNPAMVQKTWTGDASYLPSSLSWNGMSDYGTMANEGIYTATLSIDYGAKYKRITKDSRSFVLDLTAPTGSISLDPPQFSPKENMVAGPVTLTINARSLLAHMDSWSLDVFDATGGLVNSWNGEWPNAAVVWDGSSMNGGFVAPDAQYSAVAYVRDEYGNAARLTTNVAVASLPGPAPLTPEPRTPSVIAMTPGFSPNGDQVADIMNLELRYGQPASVTSWKVTISDSAMATRKTWNGDGTGLPARLAWDGKSDNGAMAPEGTYTATLAVKYGAAFTDGTSTSSTFVLVVTPPTGTLTLSSALFSPMEASDTITLKLAASSKMAKIDSWTMDIRDPGGKLFRSFTAKWPASTAVWNGRSTQGEMVISAENYAVVARVRDQFGNTGIVRATVPIDILVEKTPTGYRILASRIFFQAFTADYKNVAGGLAEQNMSRLDLLAAKLKKFAGYKIRIVGHAVMINWDRPQAGRDEQRDVLIPLSKARADAVETALVDRGLAKGRFTMQGVGASDQLVPDSDYADRWQNRRVSFFLE